MRERQEVVYFEKLGYILFMSDNKSLTEIDQTIPKGHFDKLSPADQQIVYMRVDGFMPRHITNILNNRNTNQETWLNETQVRCWFKKQGRLRKAYREKLAERKKWLDTAREKMPNLLMTASIEAFYVLLNKMRKNDVNSATEILDRAGFVATQKIDINSQKLNEAVDELENVMYGLRSKKATKPKSNWFCVADAFAI